MDLVTRTPSPPKTKCPKCNYQYHLLSDSDNEEDELTPSCPKCRRAFESDRYDEQHIEDALNESLGSINSDDAVKIVERAIAKGVCPACAVDLPSDASPYEPKPGEFCYIRTQCICSICSTIEEKLLALQAEETTLRLQDELSATAAAATASSKPTAKASMEGPRAKSRGVEAEHNSLPDDDPMPDMYRFASTCATKRIKQNRESRSKEDPTQEE